MPLLLLVALPILLLILATAWTWVFVLYMHARFWLYMRHTGRPLPRRNPFAWLEVWRREVVYLLRAQIAHLTVLWADRRIEPTTPTSKARVLCVHGFTQNGTNFRALQRALRDVGRMSESVSLGYPPRHLRRYATALEKRLDAFLPEDPDATVDLVCHSMGGLVLRLVLQRRPDLAARVSRVVTLGSPHFGTGSARGIPLPETRFMGRRSPELDALPHLAELAPQALVTTIGSEDDTTVYPVETTFGRGARHVQLTGLGHGGILMAPEAIDAVLDGLERHDARQPVAHPDPS